MARVITKQLAGVEDLTLGNSTEVQSRNGVDLTITQVSAGSIPWRLSSGNSIKEHISNSYTQAELRDATHEVNTADKYLGRQTWDSTNSQPVWADGTDPTSVWVDGAGSILHTPV